MGAVPPCDCAKEVRKAARDCLCRDRAAARCYACSALLRPELPRPVQPVFTVSRGSQQQQSAAALRRGARTRLSTTKPADQSGRNRSHGELCKGRLHPTIRQGGARSAKERPGRERGILTAGKTRTGPQRKGNGRRNQSAGLKPAKAGAPRGNRTAQLAHCCSWRGDDHGWVKRAGVCLALLEKLSQFKGAVSQGIILCTQFIV